MKNYEKNRKFRFRCGSAFAVSAVCRLSGGACRHHGSGTPLGAGERSADSLCGPNELEKEYVLNGKTDDEKTTRLIEIWTFKEAYFKYMGTGITDFLGVDYFDEKIIRKKTVTNEYICHIVGGGSPSSPEIKFMNIE